MFNMLLPVLICIYFMGANAESFITLRDHEFIGEDQVLKVALAERLPKVNRKEPLPRPPPPDESEEYPLLVSEQNLTNLEEHLKPDVFEVKPYPKVDLSMDYGELFKRSGNWTLESEAWMPPSKYNATAAQLAQQHLARLNSYNGRRAFKDPSDWDKNQKILDIMRQSIYSVQNRLLDVEPIIKKYEHDIRFRIAFMFNRIDEWLLDLRRINYRIHMHRDNIRFRFIDQVVHFSNLLRKNIDITYTIEYLIFLHQEYSRKLEIILPRSEIKKRNDMAKQKTPPPKG